MTDPERYGVVEFGPDGKVVLIEEKPESPRSNWAVTGIYFYDNRVVEIAKKIKPSERGELEITDVNRAYLELGELHSLLEAGEFIKTIEHRQGIKVASPEEVAYGAGFITADQLREFAKPIESLAYGQYLLGISSGVSQNKES